MEDIDQFVAKKVRYYRLKVGWPLKTLAANLGVSLQQVQRYESSTNKISAGTLFRIAKIFKIDLMDFYEGYNQNRHFSQESRSFRILLIENNSNDEFLIRKAIQGFSRELEVYVLRDDNSVQAYLRDMRDGNFRQATQPDIIFLNTNLSHIKGLSILSDIKRDRNLYSVPVIIFTNSIDDTDIERSYQLQASGFIRKSEKFEEIKSQIQKTLDYWAGMVVLPDKMATSTVEQPMLNYQH